MKEVFRTSHFKFSTVEELEAFLEENEGNVSAVMESPTINAMVFPSEEEGAGYYDANIEDFIPITEADLEYIIGQKDFSFGEE